MQVTINNFDKTSRNRVAITKYCAIRLPGDEHIFSAMDCLFSPNNICERIEIDTSIPFVAHGVEDVRAIIVPLVGDANSVIVKYLVDIRSSGSEIPVLGVADKIECMKINPINGLFDMAVSLDWVAALDSIKFFFRACTVETHNRALQNFMSKSNEGYWIWNIKKDSLDWSDETLNMTLGVGAEAPKSIGDFRAMIHPLDRERVVQAVDNHLRYSVPYKDIKFRLRRSCGTFGDFVANGHALRDINNRATLFVGTLLDITNEENARRELSNSENKYSFLFYEMNDAAVLAEVESGIIREVNRSAETLFGRPRSDLLGFHQSMLHPTDLCEEAQKVFRAHVVSLITNKRDSVIMPILRADGTSLNVEISSSLVDVGDELCILGIFREV